jgi:hypothetical protein
MGQTWSERTKWGEADQAEASAFLAMFHAIGIEAPAF